MATRHPGGRRRGRRGRGRRRRPRGTGALATPAPGRRRPARGAPPPEDLGPIEAFDGTKLAVRAAGPPEAPLLLFSHGFSLDMTTWREQWSDLGDEFRCVALDHRAHGRSEVPVDRRREPPVDGPGPGDRAGRRRAGSAGRADRSLDGGDGDPRARRAATGPLRRADRGRRAPRRVRRRTCCAARWAA